jgi:hypothetical protein
MLQLVQRAVAGDALTPQDVDLAIRLSAGGRPRPEAPVAPRAEGAASSEEGRRVVGCAAAVCGAVQLPEESDLAVAALRTLNALPEERLLWTCRQENVVEAFRRPAWSTMRAWPRRTCGGRLCGRAGARTCGSGWCCRGRASARCPFESQTERAGRSARTPRTARGRCGQGGGGRRERGAVFGLFGVRGGGVCVEKCVGVIVT